VNVFDYRVKVAPSIEWDYNVIRSTSVYGKVALYVTFMQYSCRS